MQPADLVQPWVESLARAGMHWIHHRKLPRNGGKVVERLVEERPVHESRTVQGHEEVRARANVELLENRRAVDLRAHAHEAVDHRVTNREDALVRTPSRSRFATASGLWTKHHVAI